MEKKTENIISESSFGKYIKKAAERQALIKKQIKEGKPLSGLKEKGIKFAKPL